MHSAYRQDITGLRGVAILAVLLFHAFPYWVPGGYAGVDVFFVLSGFLISGSYKPELSFTKAALEFYKKRFARIAPAAVFVCTLVWVAGLLSLLPEEILSLSTSLFNTVLLNTHGWAGQSHDYFAVTTAFQPLTHFWSLSIEVWFYLLFPVIGFSLARLRHLRLFPGIFLFILCLLMVIAFVATQRSPNDYYFSFGMRLWQFFFGIAVYYFGKSLQAQTPRAVASILPLLGLVLIVVASLFFNSLSNFPGPKALVPVVGTALILVHPLPLSLSLLLENRPLLFIGKISYSLYLVHQPILAYYRIFLTRELHPSEALVGLLISVAAGSVLWRWIEQTGRPKSWRNKGVYALTPLAALFLLYHSYEGKNQNISQYQVNESALKVLSFRNDNNPDAKKCRADDLLNPDEACIYNEDRPQKVALWGDSHSDQIVVPLAEALSEAGFATLQFSVAGCPPLTNIRATNTPRKCQENTQRVLDYLAQHQEISTIILHAFWIGYFDEGLAETVHKKNLGASQNSDFVNEFLQTIGKLKSLNKNVLVIGAVPKMPVNPPLYLARKRKNNPEDRSIVAISEEDLQDSTKNTREILKATCPTIACIEVAPSLYDERLKLYVANDEHTLFYRDDNHLSVSGARKIIPQIFPALYKEMKPLGQR